MMNQFRWVGLILLLVVIIAGAAVCILGRQSSTIETEIPPLSSSELPSPSRSVSTNATVKSAGHEPSEAQSSASHDNHIDLTKAQRIQELFKRLEREGVDLTYGPHPEEVAIMTEGMDSLSAARFLREWGVFDYALEYAERAVVENPDSHEALLFRARLIPLDASHYLEKETAYRQLLKMNPNSVETLVGLGTTLRISDHPWEGIPYLERAIAMDPLTSSMDAYHSLGIIYEKLGRYDEAISAYEKAYQIKPIEEFRAHIQRIREGNPFHKPIPHPPQEQLPEDSVPTGSPSNRSLESYDGEPSTLTNEAIEQRLTEDGSDQGQKSSEREDAQTWYQRLMQEDRDGLSRAHYEYAREMAKAGRFEEAAEDLHRAIELNPQHTDSYRELARVYERTQDTERAAMVYQQALERFPEDERLRREWETFRDKHLRGDTPKRPEPGKGR